MGMVFFELDGRAMTALIPPMTGGQHTLGGLLPSCRNGMAETIDKLETHSRA